MNIAINKHPVRGGRTPTSRGLGYDSSSCISRTIRCVRLRMWVLKSKNNPAQHSTFYFSLSFKSFFPSPSILGKGTTEHKYPVLQMEKHMVSNFVGGQHPPHGKEHPVLIQDWQALNTECKDTVMKVGPRMQCPTIHGHIGDTNAAIPPRDFQIEEQGIRLP